MHRFARRVADQIKTSMDRQGHRRESPISGLTTKLMAVFLIVAGIFLLINTFGSSASFVQNLPDSDVGLGRVVVEGLRSSTNHPSSMSQRRRLQGSGAPGDPHNGPKSPPDR